MQVNTRGILVIDTTNSLDIGYVCCVAIGVSELSSVVFTVKQGQSLARGEEVGDFQFGLTSYCRNFNYPSNRCGDKIYR